MTTDRDTLREEPTERERIIHRLNVLLQKLQDEWLLDNDNWYGSTHTIPAIMELIDAHDNALKEQLMAGKIAIYEDGGDNKRSFPAIPVTHIIEVFNKGGER